MTIALVWRMKEDYRIYSRFEKIWEEPITSSFSTACPCPTLALFCIDTIFGELSFPAHWHLFPPLSKLLTQLSSMLTRSQCWQKLPHLPCGPPPTETPAFIPPVHSGWLTGWPARPHIIAVKMSHKKRKSITQYPAGLMVRKRGLERGEGGVCVWRRVSQDIVPISTNTQGHLSLLMDCSTYIFCRRQCVKSNPRK